MSYNALEAKIQSIPEEYLDEVSEYIEFVIFKHSNEKNKLKGATSPNKEIGGLFYSIKLKPIYAETISGGLCAIEQT